MQKGLGSSPSVNINTVLQVHPASESHIGLDECWTPLLTAIKRYLKMLDLTAISRQSIQDAYIPKDTDLSRDCKILYKAFL